MKTPYDEIRDLLKPHPDFDSLPQTYVVSRELLERLTFNPPEGAKSKSIAFLEKILTDIRDNKTLAYLIVRMEADGEASGTHGFDGKLTRSKLERFETACMYFVTVISGRIERIKKGS